MPIPAILAAALPAIAGFIGGERANAANRAEARSNREFQEKMSSTAYQRATADMRAAGVNPMLAYMQGGASSPGGAQATFSDTMSPAVSSAQQSRRLRSDIESAAAARGRIENENRLITMQTTETESRASLNAQLREKAQLEGLEVLSRTALNEAQARNVMATTASLQARLPYQKFFGKAGEAGNRAADLVESVTRSLMNSEFSLPSVGGAFNRKFQNIFGNPSVEKFRPLMEGRWR